MSAKYEIECSHLSSLTLFITFKNVLIIKTAPFHFNMFHTNGDLEWWMKIQVFSQILIIQIKRKNFVDLQKWSSIFLLENLLKKTKVFLTISLKLKGHEKTKKNKNQSHQSQSHKNQKLISNLQLPSILKFSQSQKMSLTSWWVKIKLQLKLLELNFMNKIVKISEQAQVENQ